jgi:hypothetical protein
MFRKFGKHIIKNVGIYYGKEFEELKKMYITMIPEMYEKMWIEKIGCCDVILLTKAID